MPPIELPRRMFAGARLRFLRPLSVGKPARRLSVIREVSEKQGRTGRLAFVTVAHRFQQDGEDCIDEEQDIVYREPGCAGRRSRALRAAPAPAGSWARMVTPEPTLLFRFSALTFNAHRIHYDRAYATTEEGYPGLVVQGPLTAVLLMELVRRHASRSVTAFEFRARAAAVRPRPISPDRPAGRRTRAPGGARAGRHVRDDRHRRPGMREASGRMIAGPRARASEPTSGRPVDFPPRNGLEANGTDGYDRGIRRGVSSIGTANRRKGLPRLGAWTTPLVCQIGSPRKRPLQTQRKPQFREPVASVK